MPTTELDLWQLALARVGDFGITPESSKVVASATAANPVVCTSTAHGYAVGDLVLLAGFVQLTQVNGRIFELAAVTANTFTLKDEDGSLGVAESTGGTVRRLESGIHVTQCFSAWPRIRDEVFRSHPWNCLVRYLRLSRLAAAKTITAITKANPAVVTSAAHGFAAGDQLLLEAIGGMVELNDRYFTVASPTANTFSLSGEDSTLYTAYTSGGTAKKALTPLKPDFNYDCRFDLPADCLRVLELVDSREPWEVVGRELRTDEGITVPMRYVRRLTDVTLYDPLLTSTLVARLAFERAQRLTQSTTLKQELREDLRALRIRAQMVDGQEGGQAALDRDDWEIVRL